MKKALSLLILLAVSLPIVAEAYILPAHFIVRTLAEKQRQLQIKDWSLVLSTEYPESNEVIEERLYLKRPERVRLVQTTDEQRLYIEREGVSAVGAGESLTRGAGAITNLFGGLMLTQGANLDALSERIITLLMRSGINTEVVTLGRIKEQAVYIIGAQIGEPDTPQLWLDKDSFLPLRWVTYNQGETRGIKVEMRMSDYGSSPAGDIYPRTVKTYRDDKLYSRSEVLEAKTNQSLPESLFRLP